MNKRARNRLIGVTAIILLAVAAIFLSQQGSSSSKTVSDVAGDKSLIGKRVKVSGAVVAGSWDDKADPMTFEIREESDTEGTGSVVKVLYSGTVPSTFGDGVTAIVTGKVNEDGAIESAEMITKCPSKYESATGAMSVGAIKAGGTLKDVALTGFVKAGSVGSVGQNPRFVLTGSEDGSGEEFGVEWDGGIPDGLVDGSQVVIQGDVKTDGTIVATEVALEKSEK